MHCTHDRHNKECIVLHNEDGIVQSGMIVSWSSEPSQPLGIISGLSHGSVYYSYCLPTRECII